MGLNMPGGRRAEEKEEGERLPEKEAEKEIKAKDILWEKW